MKFEKVSNKPRLLSDIITEANAIGRIPVVRSLGPGTTGKTYMIKKVPEYSSIYSVNRLDDIILYDSVLRSRWMPSTTTTNEYEVVGYLSLKDEVSA